MKRSTWRKHHKWLGLVLGFFLIMFCLSGLVLNHPTLFSEVNIGRNLLPNDYRYTGWNKGLLRGALKWNKHVLIYGNSGIWLTSDKAKGIKDFNNGLPKGADHRNIKGMAQMPNRQLFAAEQYNLYTLNKQNKWERIALPMDEDERLSDITQKGDSLFVTSRSYIYIASSPYRHFTKVMLRPANNEDGQVSLFRTVWQLHSGGIFGIVGRVCVDLIGIILIVLTLSGYIYWFLPYFSSKPNAKLMRQTLFLHNKIGKRSIVFTLFLCITGWFLRPPGLIAIASGKVPALPFSSMDSPNTWNDELRTLRFDNNANEWLLYTSEGFYTLPHIQATPKALTTAQPPVSVMGINVQETDNQGHWLIGSFYGLYRWNRENNKIIDYFTGKAAQPIKGMPIGEHVIAGYTKAFGGKDIVADYNSGTSAIAMPQWLSTLPMSLRNVCIEVHTGRIYTFLGMGTMLYIFVVGLAAVWCIWSGWKIRCRKKQT